MSVEDRLFHLLTQARQSGGDALLHDGVALRARLSAQAPDLHGEIQALAAAIRMGAAARANGVADPLAERAAIAADIARAERLSLTVVQPAVEVACRAGIAPPPAAPTGDAWIGETIMPGVAVPPASAPAPQERPSQPRSYPPRPLPVYHAPSPLPAGYPAPAAAPFYTRTWFYLAIGAVLILGALAFTLLGRSSDSRPRFLRQGPNVSAVSSGGAPAPAGAAASESAAMGRDAASAAPESGGGGAVSAAGPTLTPYGGAMPVLHAQAGPGGGSTLSFTVTGGGGTIAGSIVVPAGWDGSDTLVTGVSGGGGRSTGRGRFQQTRNGNVPMRVMTVTWQQDGAEAGATMIGFQGQPGQPDVQLSGSIMCVMDGSNGQPVGCGRVG